jgi:hypothetical protein
MSAQKKAQNRVGRTPQDDLFTDMSQVHSVIPFPVQRSRKRVVIDRPEPDPIIRRCPTCGAKFADHTRRPNTVYCRSWCKTKMSYIKRDSAIALLATMPGMNEDTAFRMCYQGGLPKVEIVLKGYGYEFSRDAKNWVKA